MDEFNPFFLIHVMSSAISIRQKGHQMWSLDLGLVSIQNCEPNKFQFIKNYLICGIPYRRLKQTKTAAIIITTQFNKTHQYIINLLRNNKTFMQSHIIIPSTLSIEKGENSNFIVKKPVTKGQKLKCNEIQQQQVPLNTST